jgi:hypothetical protein
MLLKVTTEYFAGHKTTPNEPNPCASPFCLCLLGCLVSYRPLARHRDSASRRFKLAFRGRTALLEFSCD